MNNKGFMLLEVIIASVFLMGVMVGLFVSYNKILIAYQQRAKYYDIDCIYAAQYIQEELVSTGKINWLLANGNKFKQDVKQIKTPEGQNVVASTPESYGVNGIYIVKKGDVTIDITKNIEDYTSYLEKKLGDTSSETYEYLLIVERKSKNDIYYYNYIPLM